MMQLNEEQMLAVDHIDGPVVVLASPGSGKTASISNRTVNLIKNGVESRSIVCITFTNKSAKEMKDRIAKVVGSSSNVYISTFHSMCASLLRNFATHIGYNKNFSIIDSDDQVDRIYQIARKLGLNVDKEKSKIIAYYANDFREKLQDFSSVEEYFESYHDDRAEYPNVIKLYFDSCKKDNLIDFTGLLSETNRLLKDNNNILEKIQKRWKYFMVDECQDCNMAQFEILNMLSSKYNNVMLIGDISQCVEESSKIKIRNDYKQIKDIQIGDLVESVSNSVIDKNHYIEESIVLNKHSNTYTGNVYKIETEEGSEIISTEDHVFFSRIASSADDSYILSLYIDNNNFGFIVNSLNVEESDKNNYFFKNKLEKLFPIKIYKNFNEATVSCDEFISKYEHLDIKEVFNILDIDIYHPYSNMSYDLCLISHFNSLDKNKHILLKSTILEDKVEIIKPTLDLLGIKYTLKDKSLTIRDYVTYLDIICLLKNKIFSTADIHQKLMLGRYYVHCTAKNLITGMYMPVIKDNKIIYSKISNISKYVDTINIVDIDVSSYHNYIANNILCHNSIYRFRGARYENIEDFIKKHENCKVLYLSKNYRSTPEIVKAAERLIKHNSSHMGKDFSTENKSGKDIVCVGYKNQEEEAIMIASKIKFLKEKEGYDYSDFAVLYRINSLSRSIEQSLANEGIPYKTIGGFSFYDRSEIKDCLSMLKLLINKTDGIAFERVAKIFNGMGPKKIGKIEKYAEDNNMSIIDACSKAKEIFNSNKDIDNCIKINKVFSIDYSDKNSAECIKYITDNLYYKVYLDKKFKLEASERLDNVEELINSAAIFSEKEPNVVKYIQNISLMTTGDNEDTEKDSVSLMTSHACKGLEFDNVFIVGAEHGIIPHSRSFEEGKEGLEEERRVFYVSITRPKKFLHVSYCNYRKRYSNGGSIDYTSCKPSQFLLEADLIGEQEFKENNGIVLYKE